MNGITASPMRVGILGGGPSGLFMFKRLVESGKHDLAITIFEATHHLGEGFPYSKEGANLEHITNVSGNEIPDMVIPISEWIQSVPHQHLQQYGIDAVNFNDYKVLPRLLFGQYLEAQFALLLARAKQVGIAATIVYDSLVTDIREQKDASSMIVEINGRNKYSFDRVIICTGHHWPVTLEGTIPGYFDSPYPPKKLEQPFHHPIAIRGASLTAIDAVRTLARQHGCFLKSDSEKKTVYQPNADAGDFKIVLHSRNGMLPAVRFHLEDSHLSKDSLLSKEQIIEHRSANNGFVSLDYIFEKNFKEPLRGKDPVLYERIKDMQLEGFVGDMLSLRERINAFDLFKGEYAEAAQSIRRKESIHWKEALAILSFALNYPAKYLSAEDTLRLQQSLMPLIAIVIAFVPQSSVEEVIALHDAGLLSLVDVGTDSRVVADEQHGGIVYHHTNENGKEVETRYATYIDCTGQPHLSIRDFPFRGLVEEEIVSTARLRFRSAHFAKDLIIAGKEGITTDNGTDFYLQVPGIAINDYFQPLDKYGAFNEKLYIMAVPYIGGFNPDYSGLDFCEAASAVIAERIMPDRG